MDAWTDKRQIDHLDGQEIDRGMLEQTKKDSWIENDRQMIIQICPQKQMDDRQTIIYRFMLPERKKYIVRQ